ncbi:MAG: hypothetical protein Aurels2KO_03680 [Aureliella sp.]
MEPKEIYSKTTRHFLSPVAHLLDDSSVTEVMINGADTIYCERAGKLERIEGAQFSSKAALMAAARNIAEYAGRPLSAGRSSVDARLPDGSRVHILLPPASRCGVCISIRKFSPTTLDLARLIELETLTAEAAELLRLAVIGHRNLIVSGGTGSGKTSLLNALSTEVDPLERIVVIEDSSELQLHQPHTLYLEAQPARPDGSGQMTIRDLFVESLRMRPDRIVVGEVRRGEALDLVQSMISGHSGSMATVHASTPRDAAIRLETLSLMSGVELPIHVARTQVASAIQIVVQINRFANGRRRICAISECRGLRDDGTYDFADIYRLTPSTEPTARSTEENTHSPAAAMELSRTGIVPQFGEDLAMTGQLNEADLTRDLFAEFL